MTVWRDALVDPHAGLRPLALRDRDVVVVSSWGRATMVATRWVAARNQLDGSAEVGRLRQQLLDADWHRDRVAALADAADGPPPTVVRFAVDPYHWAVETFLTTLRSQRLREALGLDASQYSFRHFLDSMTAARAAGSASAAIGPQTSAIEALVDHIEVVRLEEPDHLTTLDRSLGFDEDPVRIDQRRSTNLDRVLTDVPFATATASFVAPRSVCFYDEAAVAAVDTLCDHEFTRLGYRRRRPPEAGGPPPRLEPARPGHPDPISVQASMADVQRLRARALSMGFGSLAEEFGTPTTRPLLFRHNDLALLMAGRAASTFAVKWYLQHNDIAYDSARWPHELRSDVVYPSEWHRARLHDARRGGHVIPLLRIARDPYRRAVSSFLHSLFNTRPRVAVARFLGQDLDTGYSFHDYLRAMEELVPSGGCDEHGYLQFHPIEFVHPVLEVYRVEDGGDRLRQIERRFGLEPTSDDLIDELRSSAHRTRYVDDETYIGDQVLPLSTTASPESPRAVAFYGAQTKALVDAIYGTDFDRLGYPRKPVGEAGR